MAKKFGKGRKPCRHCGREVKGARTMTCPHCGLDIKKQPKTTIVNGQEVEVKPNVRRTFQLPDGFQATGWDKVILMGVPLGKPPIPLFGEAGEFPDDNLIFDWAINVREKMLDKQGTYVTNEGLLRWARQQVNGDLNYKWTSPEMKGLAQLIKGLPDVTFKEVEIELQGV